MPVNTTHVKLQDIEQDVPNKIERERILPFDRVYPRLFDEHLARYKLATRYVRGKSVFDLACGAGYGSFLVARFASICPPILFHEITISRMRFH